MNKLGFGFLRLPLRDKDDNSTVDYDLLNRMVDIFLENGGTYFDTAYTYMDGYSEIALREAVVKRYPRDSFAIADKLPSWEITSERECRKVFDEQLERCGVDRFDVYLLHWLNGENYEISERFHQFEFMRGLKESGEAARTGISYHDNAGLLDKILDRHPEIDIVQLQINYLDWDSPSIQARECYETAVKHGKSVIVMEPVKGGILAKLPGEARAVLQSAAPGRSDAHWAISFAGSREKVETVLSGMNTIEQLRDNLSNDFRLTGAELESLEAVKSIIREKTAVPCTGCGYCAGKCPRDIPISEYFSMYNEIRRDPEEDWKIRPAYEALALERGAPDDCVGCCECEKNCPQGIEITKWLKRAGQELSSRDG